MSSLVDQEPTDVISRTKGISAGRPSSAAVCQQSRVGLGSIALVSLRADHFRFGPANGQFLSPPARLTVSKRDLPDQTKSLFASARTNLGHSGSPARLRPKHVFEAGSTPCRIVNRRSNFGSRLTANVQIFASDCTE